MTNEIKMGNYLIETEDDMPVEHVEFPTEESNEPVANDPTEMQREYFVTQSLQPDAEAHFFNFLQALGFDVENDPDMRDTPRRVVKMFHTELFRGCFEAPPLITTFGPAGEDADQMIYSGAITIRSTCSHHMLPIAGTAHIAIILDKDSPLPGLSKYARVAHYFAARPQVQERLTRQIANYLFDNLKPRGVGVFVRAKHFCMCHRGVNERDSFMITHALRGIFKEETVKNEFMQMIAIDQHHNN